MSVSAIQAGDRHLFPRSAPAEVDLTAGKRSQSRFEQMLDRVSQGPADLDLKAAREAATQFVASAFILPVLASLRESSGADGPFAPGPAERRFGPLLDTHIADHVAEAARFPLVDTLVDRLIGGRIREAAS